MPELTLEELAASAKPKKPQITAEEQNNAPVDEKPANAPMTGTIKVGNIKNASHANINDLAKKLEQEHPEANKKNDVVEAPLVEAAFSSMTRTIQEKKDFIEKEVLPRMQANAEEMALERELGEDGSEDEIDNVDTSAITDPKDLFGDDFEDDEEESAPVAPTVVEPKSYKVEEKKEEPVKVDKAKIIENNSFIKESDNDLDDFLTELNNQDKADELDDETEDEMKARYRESFASVKIVKDEVDLSKFKIRTNAMSASTALESINNTLKKADWGLFHTKKAVTFVECKGSELDNLRKTIDNSNNLNGVIASLRFIYDHIVDNNKPKFEPWTKLIRTEDAESLYFGLYKACYGNSNILIRSCNKTPDGKSGCDKQSLIDTDIESMVKYADDTVKQQFDAILSRDTTTESSKIDSTLIQVSDGLAIAYSPATLYSTFVQFATLKPEVAEKYADILNTMAYIDGFFKINRETNELIPIGYKEYPNSISKTIMSKLKLYTEILKTLTNDQYTILTSKLNSIIETPKVTYVYPKTTCPECGSEIPEAPVESMLQVLFMRAQSVQAKNFS